MIDTPRFSLSRNGLALDGKILPVVPPEPLHTDPWLRAKTLRDYAALDAAVEKVERHCRELVAQ